MVNFICRVTKSRQDEHKRSVNMHVNPLNSTHYQNHSISFSFNSKKLNYCRPNAEKSEKAELIVIVERNEVSGKLNVGGG
jgi:hypothetical protein